MVPGETSSATFISEFTCDFIQIMDKEAWVPNEWPRVAEIANA
jgi:hypothetical protein